MNYLYIGLGGACGAITRYFLGQLLSLKASGSFPLGTIFVNLSGAFLLGFLMGGGDVFVASKYIPILTTGFLGSYTTFSTFSYETVQLFEEGETKRALIYVCGSIVLGLLASFLGFLSASLI